MSVAPDVLKQFRMSALAAVISLRRYLKNHPEASPAEADAALRRVDSDYSQADFETALNIHEMLAPEIDFVDPRNGLRESLAGLIRLNRPWWCKLAPYGRQRLASALSTDELQTFRSAGLMEMPPSERIIQWWDNLAGEMRAAANEHLTSQGRFAEQLSLKHEQARLEKAGIYESPKWIAIEDNSAGYDILSYEVTAYGTKNRLIEVKSTQREATRLIISRGEWDTALQFGEAYVFHIWKLPSEELIIKKSSEIALHIPQDIGDGTWREAEIIL